MSRASHVNLRDRPQGDLLRFWIRCHGLCTRKWTCPREHHVNCFGPSMCSSAGQVRKTLNLLKCGTTVLDFPCAPCCLFVSQQAVPSHLTITPHDPPKRKPCDVRMCRKLARNKRASDTESALRTHHAARQPGYKDGRFVMRVWFGDT